MRSSEMVMKGETEWRRVSDYIFEEDLISVLILCPYSASIHNDLTDYIDIWIRVSEKERM